VYDDDRLMCAEKQAEASSVYHMVCVCTTWNHKIN